MYAFSYLMKCETGEKIYTQIYSTEQKAKSAAKKEKFECITFQFKEGMSPKRVQQIAEEKLLKGKCFTL